VVGYLARYLGGGPIAHRRRRACEGQQGGCRSTARAKGPGGQAERRTRRLPLAPFIGRWRLHGPAVGAVVVRSWGLYAHPQGAALARCRQQRGPGPMEAPASRTCPAEGAHWGAAPGEGCPVCGQRLGCTALLPWAGAPPQSRQLGSRSPAGRRDRGRLEADLERRSLPCRGAAGASCETRRATLSSPATDRGPNRPRGRRRGPTEGAPPGWDPLPSSRALEAVAPHAVGGPSNPVLKRTAAGSRVPLSSGLAAASHLFVRPLQFRKFTL
jgi:hypothetical protein